MAYFDPMPARDSRLFSPLPQSTQILIVGAGPVGLFAAYALSRQSVASVVIERHAHRLGQPKAHAINARTLEIFRQAGLDTEALRAKGVPADEGSVVQFMTVLTGEDLGTLPYERQDEAVKQITPEPLFNIAQPILEGFLQENALASGLVSIHRRHEWLNYEDAGDKSCVSKVLDRDGGQVRLVSSQYIIGADGANSAVRAMIPTLTLDPVIPGSAPRSYVSINFTADLRPFVSQNIAQLYFFLDSSTTHASLIGYGNPTWVYARPLLPNEDIGKFTPQHCQELIDIAIGKHCPDVQIHSAQIWKTFPAICSAYADLGYRAFLVGDSAHQFPPQGGLGVNTGVGDVHNLVWKLAYALRHGAAGFEALLFTYSAERRPVASENAKQSAVNEEHMRQLDAESVAVFEQALALTNGGIVPNAAKRPGVPERIKEAIERNRDHFDSLGLQLGYVYGQSKTPGASEPCWVYEPCFGSGARLPHAWIRPRAMFDAHRRALSTLDLTHHALFTVWTMIPIRDLPGELEQTAIVVDVRSWDIPDDWVERSGVGQKLLVVRPDQHILGHANSMGEVLDMVRKYISA
ncbi:FAD binding domain-containing protein [Aspergillus pseudoustus]|uniref:FAD binding domain-containing protein n=1 Tax=Aspergillus pseudoustus TaxID=1810923 RepID=A0ABR4IWT0_9EURO